MSLAIAVLTYNQPDLVRAMHDQLGDAMILVDNGSTKTMPYLIERTIVLRENAYFAGGWNAAMNLLASDYEWVAMLNDDLTGITPTMLYELRDSAEIRGFDAISPAFNSPHPHMQPQGKGLRQVHALDWVATLVRTSAWFDVGGFNAEAFPGYGSDLDIAYRLKQKDYRLAVDDRHVVHHIGGKAAVEGGTQHIQGNVAAMNASFQRLYGVPTWETFVQQYLR